MTQDIQQYRQPEATPVGHSGTRVVIQERPAWAISGWIGVLAVAVCIAAAILLGASSVPGLAAVPIVIGVVVLTSLVIVQPGHTKVVRFFGSYVGTVRRTGLWWIVPLADRRNLSIRVRNFETNHLKVNDADGNPVEIAAIVVWQVADTSRAVYAVDDYVNFVEVQAESALRHVATTRPYDDPAGEGTSLRGSVDLVAAELAEEVAQRVTIAGVRSSRCASAIWPMPPRSRRRCCADSRPMPSWQRGLGSSRAPLGWLKWRSPGWMSTRVAGWASACCGVRGGWAWAGRVVLMARAMVEAARPVATAACRKPRRLRWCGRRRGMLVTYSSIFTREHLAQGSAADTDSVPAGEA